MSTKVKVNGKEVYYDAAVNLMDDDIREVLHQDMTGSTPQDFVDAYAASYYDAHGETWDVA